MMNRVGVRQEEGQTAASDFWAAVVAAESDFCEQVQEVVGPIEDSSRYEVLLEPFFLGSIVISEKAREVFSEVEAEAFLAAFHRRLLFLFNHTYPLSVPFPGTAEFDEAAQDKVRKLEDLFKRHLADRRVQYSKTRHDIGLRLYQWIFGKAWLDTLFLKTKLKSSFRTDLSKPPDGMLSTYASQLTRAIHDAADGVR